MCVVPAGVDQLEKWHGRRKWGRWKPHKAILISHSSHTQTLRCKDRDAFVVEPETLNDVEQRTPVEHAQPDSTSTPFDWSKQWYPVAVVADLDPARPHPNTLLNKKLVLWCDSKGQWQAFRDQCPHRLAALSG